MATRAIVHEVTASFSRALCAAVPERPIQIAQARRQHAAYCDALVSMGLTLCPVPPDERFPDACFVEDTAIVAAGLALVTRPGAASRENEVQAVATILEGLGHLEVQRTHAPATLDGGDCLRLGNTLYVGLSQRTNPAGVSRLREAFAARGVSVVAVELPRGVLHLKCVVSRLSEDRVLLVEGTVPAAVFGRAAVVWVPEPESYAGNAVAIGDRVILAEGFPRTRDAVEAAGYRVTALQTTEFRKADGSLTCLSILL